MTMLRRLAWASCTAAVTLALAGTVAAAAQNRAPASDAPDPRSVEVSFRIAAQPIDGALKEFASQANLQLIYETTEVSPEIQSPHVSGAFTPEAALTRLLARTNLGYKFINNRTVSIRSTDSATQIAGQVAAGPVSETMAAAEWADEGSPKVETDNSDSPKKDRTGNRNTQHAARPNDIEEVVVTSYQFLGADTSGTTNLPIPIEKVPQSISLVSNDFVQAADLKTLGQIAEYTPGALNQGDPGNSGTVVWLRGFPAGLSLDGINTGGSNFYEPDYAIFDRLEVVKGPSSVVYGVSSPGGLINLVTKRATSQTVNYLSAQVGTWKNYRFEGQAAGSIAGDDRLRAIGVAVYDQGDSFLNEMYHQKLTLYGGIDFKPSDLLSGSVHGGYERFARTAFDGIPTEPDGSPAPVPRSFCICSRSLEWTTRAYFATADFTLHATKDLDVTVKGNYERASLFGSFGFGFGLAQNGDLLTAAEIGLPSPNTNYGAELSSIYRLDALGLKNSFISIGALYQENRDTQNVLFSGGGIANIFDGERALVQSLTAQIPDATFPYSSLVVAKTLTFSAQSVLQPIEKLNLLLGASHSKPDETTVTNGSSQRFDIAGQMSYRAGITYEVAARTNAYVSYSESFMPDVSFLSVNQTALPPLSGQQYEAGVKYRTIEGRLLLSGAVFHIREKNVAQPAAFVDGITYYSAIGEVTHKGLELQALGHITSNWQINAGYSYLDPKITGASDSDNATIGQRQLFLPTQTGSAYTSYVLANGPLRGLSFGGGLRYVGSQRTSYLDDTANVQSGLTASKDIPSYFLVDANAGYTRGDWLFDVNVHNLFNKHYFINNYQSLFYGNVPGDPASVALTVRRTF